LALAGLRDLAGVAEVGFPEWIDRLDQLPHDLCVLVGDLIDRPDRNPSGAASA
jgi:hypothetical protein